MTPVRKKPLPSGPGDLVAHLTPQSWAGATRALVTKALAEFAHERIFLPAEAGPGLFRLGTDDREGEYRFAARRLRLDHWRIDPATVTRYRRGEAVDLDALAFVLEFRDTLGLDASTLPIYLEEITSTVASGAFKLSLRQPSADELAGSGFQTIESAMTAGHPCFVANSGRLGFDAEEYLRYAPEAGETVRLVWLAAHRDRSTFSVSEDLSYDDLIAAELDPRLLERFTGVMRDRGLDLADYHLIPVHPWQWWNRLAVTFAPDLARGRLVCLGQGDDDYQAQQSIRTFFNTTDPSRHYVKTALSVQNMGFLRGLSATYMKATPAINDWVASLIDGDDYLRGAGFSLLRESAAIGYHSEHYEAAASKGSPYLKMLAALWRESPVPTLRPGERLATMASLLHRDRAGSSVAGALITESGLPATGWLRSYLDSYLAPVLHCFYAYDLAFMPHGENVILVLENGVPRRAFMKDIGEEVVVMNETVALPPAVERIRAEVPDHLKLLSILTDVLDSFLRFLADILVTDGWLDEDAFWSTVAACIGDYQESMPHLEKRFVAYDIFCPRFPLSCLNRLQLRDARQMVDLADPAGGLQLAGALDNPLAPWRRRHGDS